MTVSVKVDSKLFLTKVFGSTPSTPMTFGPSGDQLFMELLALKAVSSITFTLYQMVLASGSLGVKEVIDLPCSVFSIMQGKASPYNKGLTYTRVLKGISTFSAAVIWAQHESKTVTTVTNGEGVVVSMSEGTSPVLLPGGLSPEAVVTMTDGDTLLKGKSKAVKDVIEAFDKALDSALEEPEKIVDPGVNLGTFKVLDGILTKSQSQAKVPVALNVATQLGQRVSGTSNIYRVVALGPVNVAAYVKQGKLSVRVERAKCAGMLACYSPPNGFSFQAKDKYWSTHLILGSVPAERAMLSILSEFGCEFTHVLNRKELLAANIF